MSIELDRGLSRGGEEAANTIPMLWHVSTELDRGRNASTKSIEPRHLRSSGAPPRNALIRCLSSTRTT